MALKALKDSKVPFCRLSPPSSPRRNISQSVSRPAFRSKILAALDAEMDGIENTPSMTYASKPTHSLFLNHSQTVSDTQANLSHMLESKSISNKSFTKAIKSTRNIQADNSSRTESSEALPVYSYKTYSPAPTVVYTRHEEEANDLVQTLRGALGFDLEWKVIMRRPFVEQRTALVQLCDERVILLIQVSAMKNFPQKVKEVIESRDIIKMGANIRNDGQKLFRDFGIQAANLVELGALAHRADKDFSVTYKRPIVSLSRMVEMYTHKTLPKGAVRTGNWEAKLNKEQITYAANDAHCALMVYKRLTAIAAKQQRDLTPAYSYTANIAEEQAAKQTVNLDDNINAMSNASTPAQSPSEFQVPQRPQQLRAYNLWHLHQLPLPDICATLRSKDNPLAKSTVISYIVLALQADPTLPFSMERLKKLVHLEGGSWIRHQRWILQMETKNDVEGMSNLFNPVLRP